MTLEINARTPRVDVASEEDLARDLTQVTQTMQSFRAQHAEDEERFAALEEAARLAIEATTRAAEQRLGNALERGEGRIVDALSLAEQQQRDLAQWRALQEAQLNAQVRELGEWDEELRDLKQGLLGMREMAEAAIGVASDELERRWEALRRELTDILETAASDERARWEAFMLSATETLASSAGIDPAEVDALRLDISTLHDMATQSIFAAQQIQRDHLSTLRNEIRALVVQEHDKILATIDGRAAAAHDSFVVQTHQLTDWQQTIAQQLREWQARVDEEVTALHSSARDAEQQARTIARTEISGVQSATARSLQRIQRRSRIWQYVALIISTLAFMASAAAVALPFLHLP